MPASIEQNSSELAGTDNTHAADRQPPADPIRVSSPASLLAAVPVLLGFVPAEHSIVVIGIAPPASAVRVALRYDLDAAQDTDGLAVHAAGVLSAQGITDASVVGYGPDDVISQAAGCLRVLLTSADIRVREMLRAHDGRYWSYLCTNPGCCPPGGTAFNTKSHPITRKHANQVLESREALAATVASVTGDAADSMDDATRAAEERAARLARRATRTSRPAARRRARNQLGLKAVTDTIALYQTGGKFESHQDAAWLAVALKDIPVRDDAWARMDPEHRQAHLRLWTDLTTLARPGYTAPPAALLAFTAWQDGNGALANVALDRALEDDPDYSMARLLRDALDAGAPPSMARLPMTPEEVAASYETQGTPAHSAEAQNENEADDHGGETVAEGTRSSASAEGPAAGNA